MKFLLYYRIKRLLNKTLGTDRPERNRRKLIQYDKMIEDQDIQNLQKGLARVMSEGYNESCGDWSNVSISTTQNDLVASVKRYH